MHNRTMCTYCTYRLVFVSKHGIGWLFLQFVKTDKQFAHFSKGVQSLHKNNLR